MDSAAASGGHPSDVVQALTEVCRRLVDIVPSPEYAIRRSASSSPAYTDVPVFRGFEDDAVRWVQLIDALAVHHAWPEHLKRSIAVTRLHDAARAWHLYAGHLHLTWASWSEALISAFGDLTGDYDARFMAMRARRQGCSEDVVAYIHDKMGLLVDCNLCWLSPVARHYVTDGLADPHHAAILKTQPPDMGLQAYICLAAELQQSATRQAQGPHLQTSAQPLVESTGPKPAPLKDEEVSSKTPPTVIEDEAPRLTSPCQARHRPMVSSVLTQASLVGDSPSARAGWEKYPSPESQAPPLFNHSPLESQRKPTEASGLQISDSSVDDETHPKRHEDTCAPLDDIGVRRNASRSELCLSSTERLPVQQSDVLTVTSNAPSKQSEDADHYCVDSTITASTTSIQNGLSPESPLECSNSNNVAAADHVSSTAACDMSYLRQRVLPLPECEKMIDNNTPSNSSSNVFVVSAKEQATVAAEPDEGESKDIPVEASSRGDEELFLSLPEREEENERKAEAIVTAQTDEAERTDVPAEATEAINEVASNVQTADELGEEYKDVPVADDHASVTVIKADDQRVEDEAEEKAEKFSKENEENVIKSGRTSLTETRTRFFDVQDINCPDVTAALSSTQERLDLTQARKEDMNRAARARVPYTQFVGVHSRSVAECRGAKHCEAKASAVSGQSAKKAVRTAADWKRRKKKR